MGRRVIIVGDSHTDAIKRALKSYESCHEENISIEAYRYAKIKDGKQIGDLTEDQVVEAVSRMAHCDLVVSTIGGNQHQLLSLIQHPLAFYFFSNKKEKVSKINSDKQLVTYNILYDLLLRGIKSGDGKRLCRLKEHSRCQVYHLAPPPPKKNANHILKHHETNFAKSGIAEMGVSPPELRLNMWRLQVEVLKRITSECDIGLLLPPKESIDPDGFLAHEFYENDATHGNQKYGELIIKELTVCLT
jgi:hypothetical protein